MIVKSSQVYLQYITHLHNISSCCSDSAYVVTFANTRRGKKKKKRNTLQDEHLTNHRGGAAQHVVFREVLKKM